MEPITVSASINAPRASVWAYYNQPEHITNWNFASDDWCCPSASNDLRAGGTYQSRMEAKDGSFGFDFEYIYDEVAPESLIKYTMGDGRKAEIIFVETDSQTAISITFDPENENPADLQQAGWQAILNNFKKYVESLA